MLERYLTFDEVAELYHYSKRYLRQLIRRYHIPVLGPDDPLRHRRAHCIGTSSAMPLKVVVRPDTGALTITGTVTEARVCRRAESDDPKLAAEEGRCARS